MSQAGGFISIGPSVLVHTLTGNTGGAVSPTGYNINVVGDGTTIRFNGDPATSTLTASVVANKYVESLTASVGGTALPTGGNINIFGGPGVITTRAGSTITVSAAPFTILNYTNVNITPYDVLVTNNFLSVDCSGGPITVRLPDAPAAIQYWFIKDRTGSAAANPITVTTVTGVVLIDGIANYIMNTNYQAVSVLFNGLNYEIF